MPNLLTNNQHQQITVCQDMTMCSLLQIYQRSKDIADSTSTAEAVSFSNTQVKFYHITCHHITQENHLQSLLRESQILDKVKTTVCFFYNRAEHCSCHEISSLRTPKVTTFGSAIKKHSTYLYLMPSLRMNKTITLHPLHAFMVWTGTILPLYYIQWNNYETKKRSHLN